MSRMCLAYPGKVIAIEGDFAKVDFGEGTIRDGVNVSLVQPQNGDYVLVHAGYAIQIVNQSEALKTLRYWREILAALPVDRASYEREVRGGLT
jgi:hydrogenase expression/formation protein HypC